MTAGPGRVALIILPLLVLFLAGQAAWPWSWPRPEWGLIVVTVMALRYGGRAGAWFGLACGALVGLFSIGNPGLLAALYALWGLSLGGLLSPYADRPLLYPLSLLSATVSMGVALWLGRSLGLDLPGIYAVRHWVVSASLANLVALYPFLWFVQHLWGYHVLKPLKVEGE